MITHKFQIYLSIDGVDSDDGQLTCSQMQDHSIQFLYSNVFSLFSYISSLIEWLERWVYPSVRARVLFHSVVPPGPAHWI